MISMNDLLNAGRIERQTKARIQKEINDLEVRAAETRGQMDAALAAGEAEAYGQAAFELKTLQRQLDKNREKLNNSDPFYTDADVVTAWCDFVSDYNAQFAARLEEYETERHSLAGKFRDLLTMQGQAQLLRTAMHRLLHPPGKDEGYVFTLDERLQPPAGIPASLAYRATPATSRRSAVTDAVFFCQRGDLPRGMYGDLVQIADGAPIDLSKPTAPLSPLIRAYSGLEL